MTLFRFVRILWNLCHTATNLQNSAHLSIIFLDLEGLSRAVSAASSAPERIESVLLPLTTKLHQTLLTKKTKMTISLKEAGGKEEQESQQGKNTHSLNATQTCEEFMDFSFAQTENFRGNTNIFSWGISGIQRWTTYSNLVQVKGEVYAISW